MKFYYVKLSCPDASGDDKFKKILNACLNKRIENFEFHNIPNKINELEKNDYVVFILSGDIGNKNAYFKSDDNLKSFINGIYAIGKVDSITPADRKFSATLYPLEESISREQLYPYPQFSDNLGVMTKGSPNQAGLYSLDQDVYLSLLDYLTKNKIISDEYELLKEIDYNNKLSQTAATNEIFLKAKNLDSFKELGQLHVTPSNPISSISNAPRDYLINCFCEWFRKPDNFKISYEGLVTKKVLNSWDQDFFNNQIFSIRQDAIDEDIENIKKIIKNADSNQEWSKFNDSSSKGAPKAVLGTNNYLSFLDAFLKNPEQLQEYKNLFKAKPFSSSNEILKLSKPFILLAGISGTGKTRFIREQASRTGSIEKTYQLIPVRPDWHEPSDLLGYVSRISGVPHYVATDVLRFVARAWTSIVDNNVDCQSRVIKGKLLDLKDIPPYWLCLDEMNLAPVEQYFADFLSILETRLWANNFDQFEYSCDALLKNKLVNEGGHQLRLDLGLADTKHDALWEHFSKFGISIPFNLIVAGTVNMDETTHGFSRKVLDRALSFDFGDFFPNAFEAYFSPKTEAAILGYPTWSNASNEINALSTTIDKDGARSVNFLSKVNDVLEGSYFKIAYRSLNDLLLSVIAFQPQSENELQAVWDDFLMCKILPRIEGDFDKLTIHHENNDGKTTILSELKSLLQNELSSIWNNISRPDLYRQYTDNQLAEGGGDSKIILISCRSKNKILWMENRLANTSFTSYWP
jgi:hypothetical protein